MIWEDHEYEAVWRREQAQRKERWSQEVRINPSARDLARLTLTAKGEGLRGLLHRGDLYWWQAWYATHADALRWMKIASGKVDIGVEMHVCADGEIALSAFDEDTLHAALNHFTLVDAFDAEGNLKPRHPRGSDYVPVPHAAFC